MIESATDYLSLGNFRKMIYAVVKHQKKGDEPLNAKALYDSFKENNYLKFEMNRDPDIHYTIECKLFYWNKIKVTYVKEF